MIDFGNYNAETNISKRDKKRDYSPGIAAGTGIGGYFAGNKIGSNIGARTAGRSAKDITAEFSARNTKALNDLIQNPPANYREGFKAGLRINRESLKATKGAKQMARGGRIGMIAGAVGAPAAYIGYKKHRAKNVSKSHTSWDTAIRNAEAYCNPLQYHMNGVPIPKYLRREPSMDIHFDLRRPERGVSSIFKSYAQRAAILGRRANRLKAAEESAVMGGKGMRSAYLVWEKQLGKHRNLQQRRSLGQKVSPMRSRNASMINREIPRSDIGKSRFIPGGRYASATRQPAEALSDGFRREATGKFQEARRRTTRTLPEGFKRDVSGRFQVR